MFYELAKPDIKKVESYIEQVINSEPPGIYGMLSPFILRGGKRLRPMLVILCCNAVGGDVGRVIKPAGILEMFHNFSLIHDDLADDSQFRRGEPTLHISHGMPIAMNSGDALYTLVWKELTELDLPAKKLLRFQKMCVAAFKRVVEGQGMELDWARNKRFDVTEEEYLSMIEGKTSALLGLACESGAYLGGADERTCKSLLRFGEKMGAAFQIHDDILNLTGSFEKYQKEIGGDITEGKRTLMVVNCLGKSDEKTRERIIALLQSHSRRKEDIEFVIGALRENGSVEYARKIAIRLMEEAEEELSALAPCQAKDALVALCDYIVTRDR